MEQRDTPAVFIVNTVDDTKDDPATAGGLDIAGKISLRSAIEEANLNGEADTIQFDTTAMAVTQAAGVTNSWNAIL